MKKHRKKTAVLLICIIFLTLLLLALVIAAVLFQQRDPIPIEPSTQQSTAPTTAPTETTTIPTTEPATSETTEPSTEPTAPVLQNNPYTPEDFGFAGEYLTCLTADSVLGIDVSAYQTNVDWLQVKDAGVQFVILRAGFRGYGAAGNMKQDAKVYDHYSGAKAAGLKVGVYFFSQAISVEEAEEEAAFLLDIIKDFQLDMPVAYDWEYISDTARTANVDADTLTACAEAFCQKISAAGLQPMIYISENQNLLHLEKLAQYPLWAALYDTQKTYPYKTAIWQYTNTGHIPGIAGNADINLWLP